MIKIGPDDDDSVLPVIQRKLVPMGLLALVNHAAKKFSVLYKSSDGLSGFGFDTANTESDIKDLNYMLDRLEEAIATARKEAEE